MDAGQFKKWLLNEYRPPIEQPTDEQGGFLLPHYVAADKPGRWAAICRAVGTVLRSPRIYKVGTYQFDVYAAIMNSAKKARINGTNNPG